MSVIGYKCDGCGQQLKDDDLMELDSGEEAPCATLSRMGQEATRGYEQSDLCAECYASCRATLAAKRGLPS